ncbi:TPA: hypothetical protein ACQJLA_005669 [Raoultella ornithinolytica]
MLVSKVEKLRTEREQLAAENVALKASIPPMKMINDVTDSWDDVSLAEEVGFNLAISAIMGNIPKTPATDRIVAGIKADGRVEGAHFVANRMLAAWDAGFIEDTAKNAADIARMILTSTEFMADAPEGDFDRSFADGILEDIAQQMRVEAK